MRLDYRDIPVLGGRGDEESDAGSPDTAAILEQARQAILSGPGWFDAVLDAIAAWTLPEEHLDGRHYRYLVGREAFDWLLLAERITGALADLIPEKERERLIFTGRPPFEIGEEDFRERVGHRKYRAHLNYFYGVTVEEALHLAVEEEVSKSRLAHVWTEAEDGVYSRIYGKSRAALYDIYCRETGATPRDSFNLDEWREFTYWLFKFRVRWCDPAKVASDTRKGLSQLARMELARQSRPVGNDSTPEDFIEVE